MAERVVDKRKPIQFEQLSFDDVQPDKPSVKDAAEDIIRQLKEKFDIK